MFVRLGFEVKVNIKIPFPVLIHAETALSK